MRSRAASARASMAGVMSTPMTRPCGPTALAARKQSMPAPLPRSSTVSPGRKSALSSGLPQPSDSSVTSAGSSVSNASS